MKLIAVVALALVAAASAGPVEHKPAEILRSTSDSQPDGAYAYGFESDDGIAKEETGEVKEVNDEENKPHKVVVTRGSYSYVSEDGTPIKITYTADENGFHPEGDSIPKNPIPVRR